LRKKLGKYENSEEAETYADMRNFMLFKSSVQERSDVIDVREKIRLLIQKIYRLGNRMNGSRGVCRRQREVLQGKQEEDTSPEPQQETTDGVTAQERLPENR
jgi:hypothetical protein